MVDTAWRSQNSPLPFPRPREWLQWDFQFMLYIHGAFVISSALVNYFVCHEVTSAKHSHNKHSESKTHIKKNLPWCHLFDCTQRVLQNDILRRLYCSCSHNHFVLMLGRSGFLEVWDFVLFYLLLLVAAFGARKINWQRVHKDKASQAKSHCVTVMPLNLLIYILWTISCSHFTLFLFFKFNLGSNVFKQECNCVNRMNDAI